MKRATWIELRKLRGVANYQFGNGVGDAIFGGQIGIEHSKQTGRIRLIYKSRKLISTLKPTDGHLALTPAGAQLILRKVAKPPNVVKVLEEVSPFIREGGNVFAKHVVAADPAIRPMDEAIITSARGKLLAVGKAVLNGEEMLSFKKGVAVKVRRGVEKAQ